MTSPSTPPHVLPAKESRIELKISNSRFIATLAPVLTVDEAKAFIARIKAEFADATHNVPAFLVGHGNRVIAHCNDDGEPSGTAGRPMLAVLEGSGLGDAAVVVTRYFGGTKLGTGGLVRAYGDAVRAVLAEAPRAQKTPTHVILLALPYSHYERVQRTLEEHGARIVETTFGADVTITAHIAIGRFEALQTALSEMTHGTLSAEIIATEIHILPLDTRQPE